MLATRTLLSKQTLAVLSRQPACFVHHGDYGNWGNTNIAVVFSGCGWWDGTDVHEGVYTMYHLSRNGARFQMFAPNQQQMHVMDHMRKQPSSGENRNMMMEAARFSHGQGMMQMQDLSKLDVNSFDAVIFPGGHGITKNLSSFVKDGKDCKLHNDVERVLKDFHRSRKPIGINGTFSDVTVTHDAMGTNTPQYHHRCWLLNFVLKGSDSYSIADNIMEGIPREQKQLVYRSVQRLASMAPVLACRVLPSIEVTMGYERDDNTRWGNWPHTNMVQAVKSMGARHNVREPYEAYVDEKNKVVSTPTFMWETEYHYHYIFDGIGNMVKHVMRMSTK